MGVLEEMQKEGRRQVPLLVPALPLVPSCRACPPCRKVGQTNWSEAWPGRPTADVRTLTFQKPYGGSVSARSLCGFPERPATGWAPSCPTAGPRLGKDDVSRLSGSGCLQWTGHRKVVN